MFIKTMLILKFLPKVYKKLNNLQYHHMLIDVSILSKVKTKTMINIQIG